MGEHLTRRVTIDDSGNLTGGIKPQQPEALDVDAVNAARAKIHELIANGDLKLSAEVIASIQFVEPKDVFSHSGRDYQTVGLHISPDDMDRYVEARYALEDGIDAWRDSASPEERRAFLDMKREGDISLHIDLKIVFDQKANPDNFKLVENLDVSMHSDGEVALRGYVDDHDKNIESTRANGGITVREKLFEL